jgi:DNA-binding NarL/FixJ family response regulator
MVFVAKHSAAAELIMAIHATLKGQTFIVPTLTRDVLHKADRRSDTAKLSPRHREILQLLAEGHTSKEIANSLSISSRTVEFHKYELMQAYGLHNSAELIHLAIKHGVVTI